MDLSPEEGREVAAVLKKMVGTKFRHQGRNSHSGVDCIAWLGMVSDRYSLGLTLPAHYPEQGSPEMLMEYASKYLTPVPFESRRPGDVVYFRDESGSPRHCGGLTEDGIVHADGKRGQVVEHRIDSRWFGLIHSFWRFRRWPH